MPSSSFVAWGSGGGKGVWSLDESEALIEVLGEVCIPHIEDIYTLISELFPDLTRQPSPD